MIILIFLSNMFGYKKENKEDAERFGLTAGRMELPEQRWRRLRTSLVVQWLRLKLPLQGTRGPSLVRELDPTYHNLDPVQPNK